MRRRLLFTLFLFTAGLSLVGRLLPLTVKDVCLMLRSGYSSEAIQRELTTRRFAGTCDPATEKALTDAGAAPTLVDAIRSGSYQSSAAESQLAQEQLALQVKKNAKETERWQKLGVIYQDLVGRNRATAVVPGAPAPLFAELLKGDLISCRSGTLSSFDDQTLGKKRLIALYFSARWCGPCRKFTPQLVEFYNRVAPQHPEFEVVFMSQDRSPGEMETYMREDHMPWPAVSFEKLPQKAELKKYMGDGIPCLVLLDATGKVVSDTYSKGKFVGPQKVLSDLDAIFSGGAAPSTASR